LDAFENINPWTTLNVKEVYENAWIQLQHRDVLTPTGRPGIYGVVHFKHIAVGVIPIDEEGNTWLVGQYRYPLGRYSWEIPEGGCPQGTDPLETAQRELREETGLQAGYWEKILECDVSNSVTDETAVLYLARNLTEGPADPEDTEDLRLRKVPVEKAIAMVMQGEIRDSLSVIGLLAIAKKLGLQ
jgi:8-oxo-dGTP pyrophosphatase MutT (NUDIX family)